MSADKMSTIRQPVFFIPHGAGPCFFMEWGSGNIWEGMANFLKSINGRLPEQPKAIVIISAHWRTRDFCVTANPQPELIYDYYGFPKHTYELTYPATGEPAVAKRVNDLLNEANVRNYSDPARGFDHGMFIPLKVMFPDANIPVVQLSVRQDLDPAAHLNVGKALASLRDEGVLIIGSGMSFHNMRGYGDKRYTPISETFDNWLTDTIESESTERYERLKNWAQAPYARDCHPPGDEEHLIPLLVAAGAANGESGKKVYSEQVMETQLSAFQFG